MPERASRFFPSVQAVRMLAESSASACLASWSEIGFFLFLLVKASMAWTMASMPVAAVTCGGRPSVSSGSSTAQSGRSFGATTPFFSVVGVVTIEIGVTSEPVPAVVGTRISGSRSPLARPTP